MNCKEENSKKGGRKATQKHKTGTVVRYIGHDKVRVERKRKPKFSKTSGQSDKEFSDMIRGNMVESYPRTTAQRLREAGKEKDDLPTPPPQKLLRKLMSTGHVGSMGTKALMKPFRVLRHIYTNAIMTSLVGGTGIAYQLQLDQLSGFTDFTTLFDQYRFTKFTYKLIPRQNVHTWLDANTTATSVPPNLLVIQDPDDATTPTFNEFLEHQETVCHPSWGVANGSFKPRAAIAAYQSVFTGFAEFDGWCDCASDDIEWYALKLWSTGTAPTQTEQQIWDAFFSIECEFRFVR